MEDSKVDQCKSRKYKNDLYNLKYNIQITKKQIQFVRMRYAVIWTNMKMGGWKRMEREEERKRYRAFRQDNRVRTSIELSEYPAGAIYQSG